MDIDARQIEIYYIETWILFAGFLGLISWPLRGKLKDSKTLDKAAFALPIIWMVLGAVWTYLRVAGIVLLPW